MFNNAGANQTPRLCAWAPLYLTSMDTWAPKYVCSLQNTLAPAIQAIGALEGRSLYLGTFGQERKSVNCYLASSTTNATRSTTSMMRTPAPVVSRFLRTDGSWRSTFVEVFSMVKSSAPHQGSPPRTALRVQRLRLASITVTTYNPCCPPCC